MEPILPYLECNKIFKTQSGFLSKHSCGSVSQCVVLQGWKTEIEVNHPTVAVFLDQQRAFKIINTSRLPNKSKSIGKDDVVLQ